MKVAVAYNNGQIGEHFGHAECFAIYDYQDTNVDSCVKKLIDCTDRHGHQAMADLMRENDVDAVIVSQMGDEARIKILSNSSRIARPSPNIKSPASVSPSFSSLLSLRYPPSFSRKDLSSSAFHTCPSFRISKICRYLRKVSLSISSIV